MFETASFHIVKPCNMSCKFCYATFQDMRLDSQISYRDACVILDKLKRAGLKKITFAGGEPMLYKPIISVIEHAKSIGLTTSIITNGSMLNFDKLTRLKKTLDWIGISIDSLDKETNRKIGRNSKRPVNYYKLIEALHDFDFKLKINTVVNIHNENEDMNTFINWAKPNRWKIFDTLRVEGQNELQFEAIKSSEGAFDRFIARHNHPSIVPENNEAMTGSYLLIDPQGRLFENSNGKHTYSSKLQDNTVEKCLSEINLNREMFVKRGGIYNW